MASLIRKGLYWQVSIAYLRKMMLKTKNVRILWR
jgi:hypothetical protein